MQQIKFTDGCLNGCEYCYAPLTPFRIYDPIIIKDEYTQILDMNFLCNPDHITILNSLEKGVYEFVCGIDYRRITQQIANLMKRKGFIKVRWAWDYQFGLQKIHKKTKDIFIKAGYKPKELSCFILVNWKIPFVDCVKKLDLLKIWNVKVNDCCWDGGYKLAKPVYWTPEQIKKFRSMCRKHNQMVLFGIDPEFKSKGVAVELSLNRAEPI